MHSDSGKPAASDMEPPDAAKNAWFMESFASSAMGAPSGEAAAGTNAAAAGSDAPSVDAGVVAEAKSDANAGVVLSPWMLPAGRPWPSAGVGNNQRYSPDRCGSKLNCNAACCNS